MLSDSSTDPVHLSLLVPVYNLESAIEENVGAMWRFLQGRQYRCELLLVDDRSTDATLERLVRYACRLPGVRVFRTRQNFGKGACVGYALSAARGDYLVYTDADLAYPLSDVLRILGMLEAGADVAIASRRCPELRFLSYPGEWVARCLRPLLSRVYSKLARAILLPGIKDSQAGLKGFRRAMAHAIIRRQSRPRFAFDVEALLIARRLGMRVEQISVEPNVSASSTVSPLLDGARLLWALFRIWINDRCGRYEQPLSGLFLEQDVREIPALLSQH